VKNVALPALFQEGEGIHAGHFGVTFNDLPFIGSVGVVFYRWFVEK
jgi:hypothetical protein